MRDMGSCNHTSAVPETLGITIKCFIQVWLFSAIKLHNDSFFHIIFFLKLVLRLFAITRTNEYFSAMSVHLTIELIFIVYEI